MRIIYCLFVCGKTSSETNTLKKLAIFPSPAGMSLTKLSLGGNNDDVIYKLFPPRESLVSDIPAGDGNIEKLFFIQWKEYEQDIFISLFNLCAPLLAIWWISIIGGYDRLTDGSLTLTEPVKTAGPLRPTKFFLIGINPLTTCQNYRSIAAYHILFNWD